MMLMQSMQVVTFCTKYDKFNAIYVNAVNATIFVHNFLNIQLIFNPQCYVDDVDAVNASCDILYKI